VEQDLCNGWVSVCLSHLSTTAAACGGFAAGHPIGRILIDSGRYPAVTALTQHGAQRSAANASSVTFTAAVCSTLHSYISDVDWCQFLRSSWCICLVLTDRATSMQELRA